MKANCDRVPNIPNTPECSLDDGAGRHVSLRPHPISLVYNRANLIDVDAILEA